MSVQVRKPFLIIALVALCGAAFGMAARVPAPAAGSPPAAPGALDEVYARLEQSLERPGAIYHARELTVIDDPAGAAGQQPGWTTERWVDARRQSARDETNAYANRTISISTAAGQYTLDGGQISVAQPPACPSGAFAAAALLACPNASFTTWVLPTPGSDSALAEAPRTPVVTVQRDRRAGQPAIVIAAVVDQVQYRVGTVVETTRWYLDPATYLPRAREQERSVNGAAPTVEHTTITGEYVAADSVPAGFFDPTTLRELRPDPVAALDSAPPGYTPYWLGAAFPGAADVPPLALWRVDRYHQQDWPAGIDQLLLEYVPVAEPFPQQPAVRLTEYARAVWDTLPAMTGPDGPCWTTEDIPLPDGQATLFLGYTWPESVPPSPANCPTDRPRDRFVAYAYLGAAVIVIDAPSDSLPALEDLVRALQARRP